MINRRSLFNIATAALLSLGLGGCATGDLLGDFNLISPAEEQRLGQNLSQEIAKENTLITDPTVDGFIQDVGQRLVTASKANEPFQFYVIEDQSVNAFAIPGGHMYVHSGLMLAAETEAEVAAVMAHELAHAIQRHPTERMSRAMGAQMIMDVVLGDNSNRAVQTAANLAASGGISAYSRSAELQADHIALQILYRAGYNPEALVTFFQKLVQLERQSGGGPGGLNALFASHPPTPERIQAAQNYIAQNGIPPQASDAITGSLDAAQDALK